MGQRFGHNSTIAVKEKICVSCGRPCIWFSKKRCATCAKIETTQSRMEKETEKMIVEEDLSGLIADADAIFSQYIRLKYADKHGVVKCFTCNERKHWTLMQNGHYIRRGHLYLRFDERNCRPQDNDCNCMRDGNLAAFTLNMEQELPGITDILKEESRLVHKPTREEIRSIISEYTPKVKLLKLKLKSA